MGLLLGLPQGSVSRRRTEQHQFSLPRFKRCLLTGFLSGSTLNFSLHLNQTPQPSLPPGPCLFTCHHFCPL